MNSQKVVLTNGGSIQRRVSCSFGVAKNQFREEPEETIKRADLAMYLAKRAGRNRVEVDPR